METATKNKRGRPAILSKEQKQILDVGQSNRAITNNFYTTCGWQIVENLYTEDKILRLFTNRKRFFKCGVLEQLGRMELEQFSQEQLKEAADLAIMLLQNDKKSKDVERILRQIRLTVKGVQHD